MYHNNELYLKSIWFPQQTFIFSISEFILYIQNRYAFLEILFHTSHYKLWSSLENTCDAFTQAAAVEIREKSTKDVFRCILHWWGIVSPNRLAIGWHYFATWRNGTQLNIGLSENNSRNVYEFRSNNLKAKTCTWTLPITSRTPSNLFRLKCAKNQNQMHTSDGHRYNAVQYDAISNAALQWLD